MEEREDGRECNEEVGVGKRALESCFGVLRAVLVLSIQERGIFGKLVCSLLGLILNYFCIPYNDHISPLLPAIGNHTPQ